MNKLAADENGNDPNKTEDSEPQPVPVDHPEDDKGDPSCDEKNTGENKQKVSAPTWLSPVSAAITAVCTIAIVIITLFYTFYARKQVIQMERAVVAAINQTYKMQEAVGIAADQTEQMKLAVAATADQTEEMKKAVIVATEQTKQVKDQFRLEQRAWIGSNIVRGPVEAEKQIKASVEIVNTGRTPAKNLKVAARFDFGGVPDFTKVDGVKRTSSVVVFPQQKIFLNRALADIDVAQKVIAGEVTLYILGKVTYDDVFNRRQWFTFCYFYDPTTKKYKAYEKHNDTGTDP